ncbi:MAG: type II toxin-antitoxin system VapC family toxin [Pseudomonadota bacterium]
MAGSLLDTNVVSELIRPKPESRVVAFLDTLAEGWISALTLHELAYGVLRHPSPARRDYLSKRIAEISTLYRDRVLSIDSAVAERAAHQRVMAAKEGRVLHLADALIAGTAAVHGLILVTRNVSDFDRLDLTIHNPWEG